MASPEATIIDHAPDDPRLAEVWPVLAELRPHLTAGEFAARYRTSWTEGLRISAAYCDGRCCAVAGWRRVTSFSHGEHVFVDDLVTAEAARSSGVGAQLLDHLEKRAAAEGRGAVRLESGVQRHRAHRFYFRQGYRIAGYQFDKQVEVRADPDPAPPPEREAP